MLMEKIGRYSLLDEIGRGAMGVVHRAQDPAIGRVVAIKRIELSEVADFEERRRVRDRLFREAQSAGILSHPNIVTIFDIAEEGDTAYIAMEYVDGPTLDQLVENEPPDAKLVLHLLTQIAGALDYAHKRGIMHRDIKPANILIENRETAKIADFGVAKVQSHQMTHAGALIGTPNYMSPEQIQTQEVDGRSDQFSLAVIAYELLTGEKPFTGDSIAALVFKIVREAPTAAHHLNPSLSWPVDAVLQHALAKKAEDRFPACGEFITALENACRSSKGWKPIPAGAVQNLATVADRLPLEAAPKLPNVPRKSTPAPVYNDRAVTEPLPRWVPRAEPKAEPVELPPPPPPGPGVPSWLRAMRIAAVVIFGLGVIAALVIGVTRYFWSEPEPEMQANDGTTPSPRVTIPAPPPIQSGERTAQTLPGEEDNAATGPVETSITSNPSGAKVVFDGNESASCTTPCQLPLEPGRHVVAANLEGYRRLSRVVDSPGDEKVFLNMERSTGTLMIRTEPKGATVILNGEQRSEKTPAMITVPVGQYSLTVESNGRRETQEVTVKDSTITNLGINFGDNN